MKEHGLTLLPQDIPLRDFHISYGAKMIPFAGFNMPINYKLGIINENKNVRNSSGIFDVSHMGQILIKNTDENIKLLEKYIPLNLNKIIRNRNYYSFLLNSDAGIIDDIMISKIIFNNELYFFIVYNASRKTEDEKIFFNTSESILLNNNCLFAIQGPDSHKILNKKINISENMNFLDIIISNYKSENILISRSGYTGEDGFEISIPVIFAENFLKDLINDNKTILCGLGSRDSLRLEAGLSLYGNELNENITPIEAGLTWALDKNRLNKSLNGFKKLLYQLDNIPKKKKIGIISTNKSMIRNGMNIVNKNKQILGLVTSACFSPNLNKSIAIGYIDKEINNSIDLYCVIRDKLEIMQQTKLPFIKKSYKKGGLK